MEIKNLRLNNINDLSYTIDINSSLSVAGLSGSGKTSFCSTISEESLRRVIKLLPKSEYNFLFPDLLKKKYTYDSITNLPLTFFLGKPIASSNPRSTVGTHTGIFAHIRQVFAEKYHIGKETFSFNNSFLWCPKCKGRGSTAGNECTQCHGTRYSNKSEQYTLLLKKREITISAVNQLNFYELKDVENDLYFGSKEKKLIDTIINLKIGYLDLNRTISTLSGGERLRLLLAEFLISCENCLLILDEISSGVDIETLKVILEEVRKLGTNNQIWLIDHSDVVLDSTEKTIYFGPGSGENGGKIVEQSPRHLPEDRPIITEEPNEFYIVKNLKKRNIDINSLCIPKNRLTVITGESGCGKSTLINDCFPIAFKKQFKKASYVVIGQSRNKSVTSKSTIATFLDIKKCLLKYKNINSKYSIDDLLEAKVKFDIKSLKRIQLLHDLGVGYLTVGRTIQSLSSGEFQCIHMVSCLFENHSGETILAFDEPSAGLSQNILNNFLFTIRKVIAETTATILMIEHNKFLINNADFIIDFGKRSDEIISVLDIRKNTYTNSMPTTEKQSVKTITGLIRTKKGIKYLKNHNEATFFTAENQFKGGVLKQISPTAQWIYKDYTTLPIKPIIAIDFEKNLYSQNTYLFEISDYVNNITQKYFHENILDFDLLNKNNQCLCCKGKSRITVFDIDVVIQDKTKGIWDGLFKSEVMTELKRYNFSKIKFLFKEIKKEKKYVLDKSFDKMTVDEKNVFLYGFWDKDFYDSQKQTHRMWRGILFLVQKYRRESKSMIKEVIKENSHSIVCPICHGSIIKSHDTYVVGEKDIRAVLTGSIEENLEILKKIPLTEEISKITGPNAKLNDDVATYPLEKQVYLKCLELKNSDLYGFTIVLNNINPFKEVAFKYLDEVAKNNEIVVCDHEGVTLTKTDIIKKYFSSGKLKKLTYIYEMANYTRISTQLNKIKKTHPCAYCKGKGVIKENSIFEGVDTTETVCTSCGATGISQDGLNLLVEGIPVSTWLFGKLSDLNTIKEINSQLAELPLMKKIKDLNKIELLSIVAYYDK